jgi:phosphotransferase system enzyme I (PtsP)
MSPIDHIQLLCDIDELNHLFRDSISIKVLLEKTVQMVAKHSHAEVCSIYLYEQQNDELSLWATIGLKKDAVGKVKLRPGEGLVGMALEKLQPVCEKHAHENPNYRFFPGTGEEKYDSFLAVPIIRGVNKIGVLVIQRPEGKNFTSQDVKALKTVASQLANIIENAQFLMSFHEPQEQTRREKPPKQKRPLPNFIKGKPVSPGFANAPATVMDKDKTFKALSKRNFEKQYSKEDFERAIKKTAKQLQQLQLEVEKKLSDAASLIFAAHLMILKDENFTQKIHNYIDQGTNPPRALIKAAGEFMGNFTKSPSPYMQEKSKDIEDLTVRIIDNLENKDAEYIRCKDKIVITTELFPSELLMLSSENAAGIVLISSGATAHISILARSLQIPTIITRNYDLTDLPENTPLLLDTESGNIYIDPSEDVLKTYDAQYKASLTLEKQHELIKPETKSKDGQKIQLLANINLLSDLRLAAELKTEGVGLYRTEFPFIVRDNFPTESEQLITYRKLIKSLKGKPVTFRTLDVGGDKVLSYYNQNFKEPNPVMGMRSIRFSLYKPEIFSEQIRAILRAGVNADLRIMFPMISSIDEFKAAKEIVQNCIKELAEQKLKHNCKPKLGIMVELPSVISLIEEFSEQVDFFSVGTNDLIQFMLGADRTNENVSDFYLPYHPSVLRALNKITQAANKTNTEISICGDMAHQTEYLPFLLGIGIRTLSIDSGYRLKVQQAINKTDIKDSENIAQKMLQTAENKQMYEIICKIKENK